jgi:hypothetical protein
LQRRAEKLRLLPPLPLPLLKKKKNQSECGVDPLPLTPMQDQHLQVGLGNRSSENNLPPFLPKAAANVTVSNGTVANVIVVTVIAVIAIAKKRRETTGVLLEGVVLEVGDPTAAVGPVPVGPVAVGLVAQGKVALTAVWERVVMAKRVRGAKTTASPKHHQVTSPLVHLVANTFPLAGEIGIESLNAVLHYLGNIFRNMAGIILQTRFHG